MDRYRGVVDGPAGKRYVYVWADGVYCNARLEDERACLLVVMGADSFATRNCLLYPMATAKVRSRGRRFSSICAPVGLRKRRCSQYAMARWASRPPPRRYGPETRIQRCWFHKTGNVLDKLPKSLQAKARECCMTSTVAPTREDALNLRPLRDPNSCSGDKYPKAVECLVKDKDRLVLSISPATLIGSTCAPRTPSTSTFATVRLRHRRTKGNGLAATLAMVYTALQGGRTGLAQVRRTVIHPTRGSGSKVC